MTSQHHSPTQEGDPSHRGVMDADYAQGRTQKLYLNYRYRVRAQVAVNAFRRFHPEATSVDVLELGAAEGRTLLHMRELLGGRGSFTGIEYAEELLAVAPPMPGNAELMQGDVMALPESIEDESYDLATALAVLEHLPRPAACVEEAFRVLRPGGVFVATCPNPFWDQIAGIFGMVADEFHEIEVTPQVMVDLCLEAGFEEVSFEPFMWVVTGFLPYLGVDLSPELSLQIDQMIRALELFDFSFVNQAVVARKPL